MAVQYALRHISTQLRNTNLLTVRTIANNSQTIGTNNTSLDSKIDKKRDQLIKLLAKYDFDEKEIERTVSGISRHLSDEKLTINAIQETMDCWLSSIHPKRLPPNQLDKFSAEDIDYDLAATFPGIVSGVEPELLLMNSQAIEKRIEDLRSLDIISGSRDLWRMFVYAPRAYYMQHWHDLLKKYYYLQFRVLEWLLDKKTKGNLYPHPMVRNAKVMELSIDTIKCRFLFAQKTGLKSANISTELHESKFIDKIDLKLIMLSPIDQYLNAVAPNCTEEEYLVFKKMITEREADNEDAEEEKLIDELIELNQFKYMPATKYLWQTEKEEKPQFYKIQPPEVPYVFNK